MNFYTLETERLLLKKLSPDDFKYIFENHTEPEIKVFFGHNTEEECQKEKNKYEKGSYSRNLEHFLLIDKASNTTIGRGGFHNWYAEHSRAELGYAMTNENFRGKGLMSEALSVIIPHGFDQMDLHRIEAFVGPTNIPSLKLMEKYRFVKEGVLREHYFADGKMDDSIVFSKLRSD